MGARIYLDSCMIIDLIEGDETQRRRIAQSLGSKSLVSSDLAWMECRVSPLQLLDFPALKQYESFFQLTEIISLNRPVFDLATQLRVKYRLKTPDALQLAAAITAECDEFWTIDNRLRLAAAQHLTSPDWTPQKP